MFIPLMVMLFVGRDLFVIIGMLFTTIIAGLFGFSIEIIS
jgi:Na+/H+-translocating membrane pyrophosphatase